MYILCERDFLLIGDFTTKKLIKQKKKKKGRRKNVASLEMKLNLKLRYPS